MLFKFVSRLNCLILCSLHMGCELSKSNYFDSKCQIINNSYTWKAEGRNDLKGRTRVIFYQVIWWWTLTISVKALKMLHTIFILIISDWWLYITAVTATYTVCDKLRSIFDTDVVCKWPVFKTNQLNFIRLSYIYFKIIRLNWPINKKRFTYLQIFCQMRLFTLIFFRVSHSTSDGSGHYAPNAQRNLKINRNVDKSEMWGLYWLQAVDVPARHTCSYFAHRTLTLTQVAQDHKSARRQLRSC